METTVQTGPPEREPENVTPRCGHGPQDDCECFGNDQPSAAAIEAAEAARCCDPGPYCDDLPGCETRPVVPVVHLDGPGTWESENLPCGYPFNVVRYGETTSDPAKVTCAGCRATFAVTEVVVEQPMDWYFTFGHGQTHPATGEDLLGAYVVIHGTATAAREQMVAAFGTAWCDQYSSAEGAGVERFALRRIELASAPVCDASCCADREVPWPDALNPHLPQPGYTPRPYGQGPAPVEPERRTVSLEVLTDELREAAAEAEDDAKVGVVLRLNGEAVAVPEVDVPWGSRRKHPVAVLEAMLRQAQYYAADNPGAELSMPTPDVLAALDGRPNASFWTAPVPITCRWIEPGWTVVGYSGPGVEERVEAKSGDCGETDCPWPGDCTLLTIGDNKPAHFADWSTLTMRIPAAVTPGIALGDGEVAGPGAGPATTPAEHRCKHCGRAIWKGLIWVHQSNEDGSCGNGTFTYAEPED